MHKDVPKFMEENKKRTLWWRRHFTCGVHIIKIKLMTIMNMAKQFSIMFERYFQRNHTTVMWRSKFTLNVWLWMWAQRRMNTATDERSAFVGGKPLEMRSVESKLSLHCFDDSSRQFKRKNADNSPLAYKQFRNWRLFYSHTSNWFICFRIWWNILSWNRRGLFVCATFDSLPLLVMILMGFFSSNQTSNEYVRKCLYGILSYLSPQPKGKCLNWDEMRYYQSILCVIQINKIKSFAYATLTFPHIRNFAFLLLTYWLENKAAIYRSPKSFWQRFLQIYWSHKSVCLSLKILPDSICVNLKGWRRYLRENRKTKQHFMCESMEIGVWAIVFILIESRRRAQKDEHVMQTIFVSVPFFNGKNW